MAASCHNRAPTVLFFTFFSTASPVAGTNMAVQTFTMQPGIGQAEFQCPTSGSRLAVYHYFTSDEFSFQVAVAYSQANINPV